MKNNQDLLNKLKSSSTKTELELLKQQINTRLAELEEKEDKIQKQEKSLEDEKSNTEVVNGKKIEYFSQSYAAFVNTRLEKDKSLLTLSVAGLGFIVSKLPSAQSSTPLQYILFTFCAFSFLTCILYILKIFDQNAEYLQSIISKKPPWHNESLKTQLDKSDKYSTYSFISGVITTIIYAYFA